MKKENRKILVAVNVVFISCTAFFCNQFLDYKNYTLYTNGQWQSNKTTLAKGVVASWATVFTKATVSKNQLNLCAWQGYQEFIYKEEVPVQSLTFKCRSFEHPFAFILHQTDSFFYGIYFNYQGDSSACFFEADKEKRFLLTYPFSLQNVMHSKSWNQIEIKRNNDSIELEINQQKIYTAFFSLPVFLRIGFRGSNAAWFVPATITERITEKIKSLFHIYISPNCGIYVDDIVALNAHGQITINESFTPPSSVHWQAVVLWCLLLAFFVAYMRNHALNMILLNLVLYAGMMTFYGLYFCNLSQLYPHALNYEEWTGANNCSESALHVTARLKAEFTTGKLTGKHVILFIGSSQTWGAGVSNINNTIPARVEKQIQNYFQDTSFIVINGGIPGATSNALFNWYEKEWKGYKPVLTVINLSTNDYDTLVFRKYIRKFIYLNKAQKIKTLLVQEPNDALTERLKANHAIMKTEAEKAGVQDVEMQSYLDSCYAQGFLWWDYVHLTDYGYFLFTQKLSPVIIHALKSDSLLLRSN